MESKYIDCKNATIPGFYWWLPPCFSDHPEDETNWSFTHWHPQSEVRPIGGILYGPITARPIATSMEQIRYEIDNF